MSQEFQPTATGFSFSIHPSPAEQAQSMRDSLYRSESEGIGIGYPSCSRALARIPPNHNDANGYYSTLGVPADADIRTIKSAIRKLLAKFHPDGSDPDRDLFERIKEIATVLLNPIHKANYDSISGGRKLIDSVVLQEMEDAGISYDDPGVNQFARTPEDMGMKPDNPNAPPPKECYWDYLATDHDDLDLINAQEWYAYLLQVAPVFRFDATIKVLLHDGKSSAFKKMGAIMLIPRTWEPSVGSAFHMMIRHVGWPDVTRPRHPISSFDIIDKRSSASTWSGTGINGAGGLLAVSPQNVGG